MLWKNSKIALILILITLTCVVGYQGRQREKTSTDEFLLTTDFLFPARMFSIVSNSNGQLYNDHIQYRNQVTSYEELLGYSEVVVEVEPITRVSYKDVVETKVIVHSVQKEGREGLTIGDTITIFEHYHLVDSPKNHYVSVDSLIVPMHNGTRYLAFLNPVQGDVGYDRFNLASTTLGIIPISNDIEVCESSISSEYGIVIPQSQVMNCDYVVEKLSEEDYLKYESEIQNEMAQVQAQKSELSESQYNELMDMYLNQKLALYYFNTDFRDDIETIIRDALKEFFDIDVNVETQTYN